MSDQVKEYEGEELSTFQLKRVIRAMAQKYPMPITAYLSDVVISSDCALGVVFGQPIQGRGQHLRGYALGTKPIYTLSKIGRYWVISSKCGNYVLTSFRRGIGRESLRALIATADETESRSATQPGTSSGT
ncbi:MULTISPECIES: hypothetical protein [Pseudomonas]|uniref:hypothetical protein n=1 Tax=Pseudomonas TaxID=286 RepID=UPI000692204A|nr:MULTISPECIES: hypothetical protein [Pseudomonas]MCO7534918.1 hypothetical protein [Pseudomonas asiatica]MCO7548057.1 hypothetical protein [Pseudomonas asiatica]MCO7558899.1 hypothetical protein [Pseudomonas asiatica]